MKKVVGLILCFSIFISACAGSIKGLPVSPGVQKIKSGDPDYREKVQIKYLGAGGFLMRRGEHVILTAPFFSNPSIKRLMLWRIKSNPQQIDRFFAPMRDAVKDVEVILVGHAHYDHLMDVPYIVENYIPQAKVYGSQTMEHILAAALPIDQLYSLNADAGTSDRSGKWHPAPTSRIRFMAIESEHAPHFMGIKVFKGKYRKDKDKLPARAAAWREGQTFAYLIDFMSADGKTVEFRIHYQDATSNPPLGFPPSLTQPEDQRRVDVAIVCVAGYEQVKHYPESIIQKLNPRFVVLGHWENFFSHLPDDPEDLRTVPMMNAKRFIKRLKTVFPRDDRIKMPAPGAWMQFDL